MDVGLLFDASAGYADWFIPVKPGSDTALALCMANQIVQRKEYDRAFMTKYTVAPLLVDVATGKFATSGDKFLYWDEESQSARETERGAEEYEGTPAFNGEYVIDGAKF